MRKKLRSLNIKTQITWLGAAFVCGFAIFGSLAYTTIQKIRIGGDQYNEVVCDKDLLADCLPPLLYVIENYLSSQLMYSPDEVTRTTAVQRFYEFKESYETSMANWMERLPNGALKDCVKGDVKRTAEQIIDMIENELLPAFKQKDRQAATAATAKINALFLEHQVAIESLVKLVTEKMNTDQAKGEQIAMSGIWELCLAGILTLACVLGLSLFLRKSVAAKELVLLDSSGKLQALDRSQAQAEFDISGKLISTNANFQAIFGYSERELLGQEHGLLVHPKLQGKDEAESLWPTLTSGQFQCGEYMRVHKDGKTVWLQGTYNPLFDDQNRLTKIFFSGVDVTERNALLEEVEELRVRVDIMNMTSIVSEANLKGEIIACNDKYCEVSQYSRDEAIGQGHNLTRHPDMPKEVFKELWSTIGRGKIFRGVVKNRKKDGSPYYVDAVIAPIMGKNGKPRKYIGVRYDITEAEIERQNAKAIIAAIDEAYAYIELDPNGNVIRANDNFLATLAYRREEIIGKNHRLFVNSAEANSHEYNQFWEDLRAGRTKPGVYSRLSKSGEKIWIQAVYAPVKDEVGRVVKVVAIAIDITKNENANIDLRNKVDSLRSAVLAASSGDLTANIEVIGQDPIGQLGEGLCKFLGSLRGSISSISDNATALAEASVELSAVSSQMSANASETASQAQFVSTASEEVNANVSVVATGVEELNSAIREIAKNATDAARVSQQAVTIATVTNKTISKLGDSSMEIGKVVKVITSIAEQTNLLALNATIEAARAGEAGKGFAVVANEVKELAKETARATEDISHKIEAIQADTSGAIAAIQEIGQVINQINDISNTIASAVEEQTATANEMGRNVAEASRGSSEIYQNITLVASATQSTTEGANNSMHSAGELSRMADNLQRLVNQFKIRNDSIQQPRQVSAPLAVSIPESTSFSRV